MAESKSLIRSEIQRYIKKHGNNFGKWYVGITSDIERRLFSAHNVDKSRGTWIYLTAESSHSARDVKQYFLDKKKTMGAPGGGFRNRNIVYAYKISNNTVQETATRNE